jgi:NAD(P)-dependent dehydrogenase (short-subunit alcohol dehydrogenase family)
LLLPTLAPLPALAEVGDMTGKTVVVTGANSGLGLATATELAKAGGTIVLAVRDPVKGEEAKESIRTVTKAGNLEVSALDLGDLSSVRAFAKRWGDRPCDALVLNAGVMAIPDRTVTVDGFERHFGVNHLGHFALTALLWPALKAAATGDRGEARVVVVSSDGHKKGEIAFDDLQREQPGAYKDCSTPFCSAYTQSKLANVMFAKELERRVPAGLNVAVSSVSPGLVNTALFRYALPDLHTDVKTGAVDDPKKLDNLFTVQGYFMTPATKAAQTQLALASDPALGRAATAGRYFVDGKPAEASKPANDAAAAAKLWSVSEQLTGIKFEL